MLFSSARQNPCARGKRLPSERNLSQRSNGIVIQLTLFHKESTFRQIHSVLVKLNNTFNSISDTEHEKRNVCQRVQMFPELWRIPVQPGILPQPFPLVYAQVWELLPLHAGLLSVHPDHCSAHPEKKHIFIINSPLAATGRKSCHGGHVIPKQTRSEQRRTSYYW